MKSMSAKAKKREATALASSGKGGSVYPPNECSVAEGDREGGGRTRSSRCPRCCLHHS